MIKTYHVTVSQGRDDSLVLESSSSSKILNFFNTVSTAIVSSIKEIVYSKEKNINYTTSFNSTNEPSYRMVEIFCKSDSYAKVFTLYHVPLSVTEQVLIDNFKKLMIHDEKITDVLNVLFYEDVEGVARLSNYQYQVFYRVNSKSHHVVLEGENSQVIKDFFEKVLKRDLEEIRYYVHKDDTYKKDDGDYTKFKSVFAKNIDGFGSSFKIPKIKKNITNSQFEQLVHDNFKVHKKDIKSIVITTKF